jgi:hypothetical protein
VLLTDSTAQGRAAGGAGTAENSLRLLAVVHCHQQQLDAALECLRNGLSAWRASSDRVYLPFLLEAAAIVTVVGGDHRRGLRLAAASVSLRVELELPIRPAWLRELKILSGAEPVGA